MPVPCVSPKVVKHSATPSLVSRVRGEASGEKPPRVLFLSPQPFMIPRGSPYRVCATLQGLAALGFEVDLICYPIGSSIDIPGVRIIRSLRTCWSSSVPTGPSLSKLMYDVGLAMSAIKAVLSRRYQVIHGVEEAGILAALLGRLTRTPYVFDMHSCMSRQISDLSVPVARFASSIMRWIEQKCIQGAHGVMTVSREVSETAEGFGAKAGAVHTIMDTALTIDVSEPADPKLLDLCGHDRSLILYAGNFDPWQGLPLLIESFALLKNARVATSSTVPMLVIVGGSDADAERKSALTARVRELGLTSDVHFVGSRTQEELGHYFAAASVLVSPRVVGNNPPLKIYTYLAARRPVVATSISAHTQVLDDSLAFLAPPEPASFAGALERALTAPPEVVEKMVLRGADLVERNHSQEEFDRHLAWLYQAVLATDCDREKSGERLQQPTRVDRENLGARPVTEE